LHILKFLVGALAMPLTCVGVLLVVAGALWLLRRRRMAAMVTIASIVVTYLACTPFVAGALLAPLARGFTSPLDDPPQVRFVVILGSWYSPRADLPVTASMNFDALARLTEGMRLLRLLPQARLIVSGGVPPLSTSQPSARGYARMARALGIEPDRIIVLDRPGDTAQEARALAPVVGSEPFLLVTSSAHLRRAMQLMDRAGLRPIAAPATRLPDDRFEWGSLIPNASGLRGTEVAIHEYLGLAAISLGLD
jgi:uncharacterized SAM-binding protein YcdF (DUF218 family)